MDIKELLCRVIVVRNQQSLIHEVRTVATVLHSFSGILLLLQHTFILAFLEKSNFF